MQEYQFEQLIEVLGRIATALEMAEQDKMRLGEKEEVPIIIVDPLLKSLNKKVEVVNAGETS